jgi:hypothetical protein
VGVGLVKRVERRISWVRVIVYSDQIEFEEPSGSYS